MCLVEAAKKKKKVDDRRPTSVEALLYCNSCQAVIREVLKKIKDSKKEYDVSAIHFFFIVFSKVTDALANVCQMRHFSVYEYPPPDMKKGCEAFMSGWAEELEAALIKRESNAEIED